MYIYSVENHGDLNIIHFLSKYAPINKDLEEVILKHSGIKRLKKGTTVLREGQLSSHCFFILKGCMKKYFLIDGEEKITGFYTEGQVVTPNSYSNQKPSKYFISTLENTIALFGNAETEQEAINKYPDLTKFIGVVTEKIMVQMSDEFDNWVSNSPEERYLLLLENRPELINRIPQYQIANYLGIKPESLSRIRKRLTRKSTT